MSIPIECPNCRTFVRSVGMRAEGTEECPECGYEIDIGSRTFAEAGA